MLIYILQSRSLGDKVEFNKFYKILNSKIEIESKKKQCDSGHAYGYAPFIPNGSCRFCWGYEIKSDKTIFEETWKFLYLNYKI